MLISVSLFWKFLLNTGRHVALLHENICIEASAYVFILLDPLLMSNNISLQF